ncbi:class I SAM-dependent methyltransferase [Chamaesiphon minutus]|uniref:Methyltransferase family protein n=1 Tax=Chamaesiphon minutus (strain ATCC 27169 / PCC 6605) TaxID=1173020 RepID=K9UG43_CHAP6|nr:class I SAM-dependent methyltransferase [Chamaesiphon minutus]AFY93184.1 hypothetical protein Cha6605_2091 [Chamaesiphon minutus PCC 6605]
MTVTNIDGQLTLDFSVPANCPPPNPNLADKLQKLAAAMDTAISSKLSPSISHQNITARRSRIAASMREDGRRLQLIQSWLMGLAVRHRDGTCPTQLSKISNRSHLDSFASIFHWQKEGAKSLEYLYTGFDRGDEIAQRLGSIGIHSANDALAAVELLESLGNPADRQIDPIGERVEALRRKAIYQQVPDFYPTPGEIISRMLQLANVQPQHPCLDPEGGAGDICVALRDLGVENIDCFELNAGLAEALTLLGFVPLGRDFLTATPRPIYDRILMNPPFGEDAYIQHVRHAYDWLAPGGELVAVLPIEHPSRIKKRRQFSEWLDSLEAIRYPNPSKAFTKGDLPRQRLRYRYCAIETHLIHLCR